MEGKGLWTRVLSPVIIVKNKLLPFLHALPEQIHVCEGPVYFKFEWCIHGNNCFHIRREFSLQYVPDLISVVHFNYSVNIDEYTYMIPNYGETHEGH